MQAVFRNAFYHKTPTVLLRQLLPLSLGHVHQLYAADSPYVCGGNKTVNDLALAVAVCSRTWEELAAWLHTPGLLTQCKRWGRKASFRLNFFREHNRFVKYLDDYTQMPDRWQPDTKGGKPKVYQHPWTLIIATELLDKVGESRAWNMPLPLALSYWSALAELRYGDDSLKTPEDDKLREMQKKYMAEQAAKTKVA